jgi:hypothetical protein
MHSEIKVDVEGDLLVASLLGTSYRAIYFISRDQLKLIQSSSLVDKEAATTHREFEALAWEAANKKARELGWIA